jgi:hypothetical protein
MKMKKAKFSYKYKDNNDGEKITAKVVVCDADLTKDLGQRFVFIDITHIESSRSVSQDISLPVKAVKKLIKALQKVAK